MKIEWVEECADCQGTGLYVGIAERDGAAVVCYWCKGTGKRKRSFTYQEFTGRKPKLGVRRVYDHGAGYILHPEVVPGGVTLQEWEKDPESVKRRGSELREHTCPLLWYQTTDDSKKPDWDECIKIWGGRIKDCKHFPQRAKCWERFDKEQEAKGNAR